MNPPYTREFLQNYTLDDVLRTRALEKSVKSLTTLILDAASGAQQSSQHANWKMAGKHTLVISDTLLRESTWASTPYGTTKTFPENIFNLLERLHNIFPDVDFRQDELGSYLIVDWS